MSLKLLFYWLLYGVSYSEVQEGLKLRCESCPLCALWVFAKYQPHSLDSVQDILRLVLMTYLTWLATTMLK